MPDSPQFACYLLMRTDVASLNTGKACAQSHHAGTKIVYDALGLGGDTPWKQEHYDWLQTWLKEADGFGTVLTMAVDERTMAKALDIAQAIGFPNGRITDPSYPILDGKVLHTLPFTACGYIFGPLLAIRAATIGLDLHRDD